MIRFLTAVFAIACIATPLSAQSVGTYTEDNGAVKNNIGVSIQNSATGTLLATTVVGNTANGTTDTGAPVKTGCYAMSSAPTTVTNGQRVNSWCGLFGQSIVAAAVSAGGSDSYSNNGTGMLMDLTGNTRSLIVNSLSFNGTGWDRARTITGAVADGTGLGVSAVEHAGALFNNITTATTTTVKSGKGIIHKLIINTHVASATITLYDSTTATGTKIGTITLPSAITANDPIALIYDLQFSTGLTIVTSGATDITIIYR